MSGELSGRYRLLELIGAGGMGRVWRAEDTLLQRAVAIKEMTVQAGPELVAQVVREARAAARLDHPGVVKVYDVLTVRGISWIVMEYVPSRSLHHVVRQDGPMPPHRVARIGLEMLAALRTAHAAGVLHRDVKPDNVLLATDGRVVLGDFGLATIGADGPDPRLGSPSYIAPERVLDREAGVPGDLWSLAATLYFAVEDRPPFRRDDGGAALRALLEDPPDPPVLAGPLTPLLMALLDKDPARRPKAPEVAARLRAVVNAATVQGRARVPVRRSKAVRLALAGGMALVAIAGGLALAAAGRAPDRPVAARPSGSAALSRTLMSYPVDACGYGASSRTVTAASERVPAGLPRGWVWFRDPSGFALALPAGWQRSTSGNDVCFTDPGGRRAFTVNVSAVVTDRPLDYWQRREKAERSGLPGYERISMGVLLLKRGGADWEFTWRPDSDAVRHERRVLVAVAGNRSYLLRWTVPEADWAATTALQRRLVSLFGSAE